MFKIIKKVAKLYNEQEGTRNFDIFEGSRNSKRE